MHARDGLTTHMLHWDICWLGEWKREKSSNANVVPPPALKEGNPAKKGQKGQKRPEGHRWCKQIFLAFARSFRSLKTCIWHFILLPATLFPFSGLCSRKKGRKMGNWNVNKFWPPSINHSGHQQTSYKQWLTLTEWPVYSNNLPQGKVGLKSRVRKL